jgi:hypothetical protein
MLFQTSQGRGVSAFVLCLHTSPESKQKKYHPWIVMLIQEFIMPEQISTCCAPSSVPPVEARRIRRQLLNERRLISSGSMIIYPLFFKRKGRLHRYLVLRR